jgi:tetratricopeptide (TPR) repeat protein
MSVSASRPGRHRGDDAPARSLRRARRIGSAPGIRWLEAELAFDDYLLGRWDRALERAERFLAELANTSHYMEGTCLRVRSAVSISRGATEPALADAAREVKLERRSGDPQVLYPALSFWGLALVRAGRNDEALAVISELLELASESEFAISFVDASLALVELGRAGELAELAELVSDDTPYGAGIEALARGELSIAADSFESTGSRVASSYARLLAAERLAADGRQAEAETQLSQALAFYREVGASAYVRRAEALLAASA